VGDGYNFTQLKNEILARSRATDWETARKEWALLTVYEVGEPDTCLCGHYPIIEICEIENRVTKSRVDVGNVCIKRFLGFRSDLIFAGLKRIQKDLEKSLNADAVAFFYERGALTDWEYSFLQNTMRKRKLSSSQVAQRRRINQKILGAVAKRGFRGPGG
jgi:hypothetical protein